ncbi:MAG: hypothetical protein HKM89_10540 [Gemmatimonadales bacterium]|nr:hypothetical protein [Gemmatimonadales bacterium]
MIEPIVFVVLLVLGIYIAMKVAKMLIRLAIFVALALAFYFFVYPKIAEFLQ